MATVGEGNKAALVVVDVQIGVMREAWDASRVVGNVARAVERARAENVPVIWVHTQTTTYQRKVHSGSGCQSLYQPKASPASTSSLIHRSNKPAYRVNWRRWE